MSKPFAALAFVAVLFGLSYWWTSDTERLRPSAGAAEDGALQSISVAAETQVLAAPTGIQLAISADRPITFSIALDDSHTWDFPVAYHQSHPNGDYSLSGTTKNGETALVTVGEKRMYATVAANNEMIEITAEAGGDLVNWRIVDPDELNLKDDVVLPPPLPLTGQPL